MDIAKIRKRKRQIGEIERSDKAISKAEETDNLKSPTEEGTLEGTSVATPYISEPMKPVRESNLDTGTATLEPLSHPEVKYEEEIELLVFKLGSEEYSFRLGDVREILKKQFITNVPLSPFSVIGITTLRGTVIPVIDLSLKLLGIPSRNERKNRILIMEGVKGIIGCIVDEVEGVVRCSPQQRRGLPENMTEKEKAFMEAIFVVDNRFITLLKKDIIELTRFNKEVRRHDDKRTAGL